MSEPIAEDRRRRRRKAAVVLIAAGSIGVAATGVYAVLQATASNTTPEAVDSGVLSLTMSDNGAGLTTAVTDMAPGDVVHRFVALANDGSLAGQSLDMSVVDGTPTALSTDAARGLQVQVDECTVAWDPATNACAGTASTVVADRPLAGLATAVAVGDGLMAVGETRNLRLTLRLADSTETTVNGALPAGTIQGLSAALTWTFTEAQRTATVTSS